MPRKVLTRKWLGTITGGDALTVAIKEYLTTGDRARAVKAIRASDAPPRSTSILWNHEAAAAFWLAHRAEIRREAKHRGFKAFGEVYEHFADGTFAYDADED